MLEGIKIDTIFSKVFGYYDPKVIQEAQQVDHSKLYISNRRVKHKKSEDNVLDRCKWLSLPA